jgi:Ran GTPase-activating protein (RanGAP) involved in mRNA processing and transport
MAEEKIQRIRNNDATLTEANFAIFGTPIENDESMLQQLADALRGNTSLTAIDLGGNELGAQGVKYIADALRVNTSLTTVYLGGNEIGDQGAQYLADALRVNSSLNAIYIESNNISAQGARSLADALQVNTSLTEIHLQRNDIGDDSLKQEIQQLCERNKVRLLV